MFDFIKKIFSRNQKLSAAQADRFKVRAVDFIVTVKNLFDSEYRKSLKNPDVIAVKNITSPVFDDMGHVSCGSPMHCVKRGSAIVVVPGGISEIRKNYKGCKIVNSEIKS